MTDHEAIYQLYTRYAAGMDSKQFDMIRSAFADDARFSIAIKGTEAVPPIDGGQAITDFIESTTRGQNDQRRHVITNIRIGEEDGKLIAYGLLSLFVNDDDGLRIQATGQYRSEILERSGDVHFGHMHLDLDGAF